MVIVDLFLFYDGNDWSYYSDDEHDKVNVAMMQQQQQHNNDDDYVDV